MPKERKIPPRRSRFYSFKPYASHLKELASAKGTRILEEDLADKKDWEEATCPICMDSPHNAVLLLCSSHDKGCRPFMCDTSYRHSNCFDQYRKAHTQAGKARPSVEGLDSQTSMPGVSGNGHFATRMQRTSLGISVGNESENIFSAVGHNFEDSASREGSEFPSIEREKPDSSDLTCPLCRGNVIGWVVIETARQFLNIKTRTCSQDACSFVGTYEELRAHARCEHPSARPTDIDPVRERDWRRLERQRDLGDVLSTIRSAIPGATFFGDYVIEGQDDYYGSDLFGDDGHWWTFFLLCQVLGPAAAIARGGGMRPRMRGLGREHFRSATYRYGLWGEDFHQTGGSEGNSYSESSNGGRRRHRSQH